MREPLFAGIDLGTSGCRLMVINADKKIQFSTTQIYSNPDEQTPQLWWDTVCALFSDTPEILKKNIRSLSIDGTSGTVLLVDDKGEPLSQALMYNDLRATKEAEQIKLHMPINNGGQGAAGSLARVMWLLKHTKHTSPSFAPFTPSVSVVSKSQSGQNRQKEGRCTSDVFNSSDSPDSANEPTINIVHQADYIVGKLCNNFSISDENNCLKLGYDVVNQCWPITELATLGINKSYLPRVFPAGTPVANITKTQANALGLSTSLKLVTGTTDSIAAFIATGADTVGDGVTSLGSTLVLKLISDKPLFSPEEGIYSHRLDNHWLVGGASNSGAKVLQHYFSQTQIDELTTKLLPDNPTHLGYYPLINTGERFPLADPQKQGKLSPRPDSDRQFFQGILEGIANIEALGYQKLTVLGGLRLTSVRSVGGGSKNSAWTSLRKTALTENQLAVKMITPEQTEAAYGSALLALKGFKAA